MSKNKIMQPFQISLAQLVINKTITPEEADKLSKELGEQPMPKTWQEVLQAMETTLGRKI